MSLNKTDKYIIDQNWYIFPWSDLIYMSLINTDNYVINQFTFAYELHAASLL